MQSKQGKTAGSLKGEMLRALAVLEERGRSRLWHAPLRVASDEQLAHGVVGRSVMAEEAEQVDEKGNLGLVSLYAVGSGESDFAVSEISANLGGSSKLPIDNRAFPIEGT